MDASEGTGDSHKDTEKDEYKMNFPRRGKAVIINNKNFTDDMQKRGYGVRSGTDIDHTLITAQLQRLGFDLVHHHNATCRVMKDEFAKVAKEDHFDADCFVTVLLSHGEEGKICGTDDIIDLEEIFQYFKGAHCPTLAGKPKLFFIQACRGKEFESGTNVDVVDAKHVVESDLEISEVIRIPSEADFLLSFSTVPGYYSWRNSTNGSWYIQSLCCILDQYGTVLEIQKLLTKVAKLVAYTEQRYMSNTADPAQNRKKQMPSFTSMLTKDLIFHPKDECT
ncbi:caspase-7-like isoform X2 [Dreissena polymorpha]|uniref:caspase-7-like isoform X2 n=1 Tax=Dreissena polymorpha TaxID=45954 RepID=UPI0022641A2A|nr:caspase-7-like isoform X2 [Dreissena polymorpha]